MICNFIDDIYSVQPYRIIKCCGVVLSTTKQNNFFSFIINDGSASAQASIYQPQPTYKHLILPSVNDSVMVIGFGLKKQFGKGQNSGNYLLKIKVSRYKNIMKVLSLEQEFEVLLNAVLSKRQKIEREKVQNQFQTMRLKNPVIKELRNQIDPIEIRSLILCCLYMTLENNADLQSYRFSCYTVKKHRLTKNFLESKKLKEEYKEFLVQFIEIGLIFLAQNCIIEDKGFLNERETYSVEKKFFNQIQLMILTIINDKKDKGGATLGQIFKKINNNLGFYDQKNFIFNQKLIQTIIKKFMEEHKIYKTHDKMLLPNN